MKRLTTVLLALLVAPAMAAPGAGQALYRQECAACHIAYPPAMLPAASWQRMLGNLQQHYGTDASLDAASVQQLSSWLGTAAGPARHVMPPDDRITRSPWFIRKHDDVSPAVWKRASIKSASNCMACHSAADKGEFNEHNVHIPR